MQIDEDEILPEEFNNEEIETALLYIELQKMFYVFDIAMEARE